MTSSVPVIFDYRLYFLPLSQVFQSYYLVLCLINEVASVQEKNDEKIKREKNEMLQLTSVLKDNKQELEMFLRPLTQHLTV
jgi:hypothetical protein